MVEESSPLLPRAEEFIEAETETALASEPETGKPTPTSEHGFVCDCKDWMLLACQGLPFYKEHESRRYCVLHYPGNEKSADFKSALDSKLNHKDFDFRGVWFPDQVDFGSCEFSTDANFISAMFSADAYFDRASFTAGAYFGRASFSAYADFKEATFSGVAGFNEATFSTDANFISAMFSADALFGRASFSAEVDFTDALFSADADFTRAMFSGDADFSRATFSRDAYFKSATFSARADFSFGRFNVLTYFTSVTFSRDASFLAAQFNAWVDFSDATFRAIASFGSAKFTKTASFSSAQFDSADFMSATFSADARFNSATFKVRAYFMSATFTADQDFSSTTFSSHTDFSSATFRARADFNQGIINQHARFGSAFFADAVSFFGSGIATVLKDGTNIEASILGDPSLDFQHARFERPGLASFHRVALRPHWFVNVDSRQFVFTDVGWQWDHISIKQEISALEAIGVSSPNRLLAIACRQLAENAETNNRYEEASKFRYWAMDLARRDKWKRGSFWKPDWLHMLYWAASGYGERIRNALGALASVWLLFVLLYTQVGFVQQPAKASNEGGSPVTAAAMPAASMTIEDRIGQPLEFSRALTYSLAVMSLQKPEPKPLTGTAQALVLLETILGPVQAALLALAIRRKFMR